MRRIQTVFLSVWFIVGGTLWGCATMQTPPPATAPEPVTQAPADQDQAVAEAVQEPETAPVVPDATEVVDDAPPADVAEAKVLDEAVPDEIAEVETAEQLPAEDATDQAATADADESVAAEATVSDPVEDTASEETVAEETVTEEPQEEAVAMVAPPGDAGGNAALRTSREGVELIKEREGLRLEAYTGPAGVLLIGYGHAADVTPGMTITEVQAEEMLREDLRIIEDEVKKAVYVPINVNELSAMVVLAYNIGTGAFGNSSVVKRLNEGDRAAAADAFLLWNKIRKDGELTVDPYLAEHREKERALFLKPMEAQG